MLSFGYSLLTQEVISAVNTVGLDPYMGFLHHPRIGRPSLALDLIEEFRTPIVDSLVLKLVFTNSFSPKDFILLDGESPRCLLLPEARKRFLSAYERRMLTLFTHIPTGRRVTWRQSLGLQSRKLADSLMREDIQYTPIIWK
jgi:CRISPR-associated protein Cas1